MRILFPFGAGLLATAAAAQAQDARRTYANPIDIDYRYNFEQVNEGISYRTGADPAIVTFKGGYYLFQTLADGYWSSRDLVHWTFVTPSRWPMRSIVAPAVWTDGERIIIQPSMMEPNAILSTSDPDSGKHDFFVRRKPAIPGQQGPGVEPKEGEVPPGPWDPALFKDEDGKWYMYWGSSNVFPLYGMEIAFGDGKLAYKGRARPMLALQPERHGWERFGQDHSGTLPDGTPIAPFMEGAWMTKAGGRYYLQYGAPGTEYNAYANGTYVSDKPLGPFEYAPWNPVAYKPGGFVQGAGHGSTFQDVNGNWWNTGTPWIGYNWTFERRIGMWPAKFWADGQMSVSTRFGDFPHYAPGAKVEDPERLFTGWMLLSYRKAAVASSTAGEFAAARATDENPRTFWVAGANKPGETLTVDLGAAKTLRGAGELRRLQVRPVRRRAGHLYRVRAAILARRQELAPAGQDRGAAPRPAQRLFPAAGPGGGTVRALCARACRRREPGDQRPARVRQRGRQSASDAGPGDGEARRRCAQRACDVEAGQGSGRL